MPKVNLPAMLLDEPEEPTWIVPQMFPRGELCVLVGQSNTGKSVFCYTLAYCTALGLPFLGRLTVPTSVIYYDEENSAAGARTYNRWVWRGLDCPEPATIEPTLTLFGSGTLGADWLVTMAQHARQYRPGLIIIDTATIALGIEDENDTGEATQAIKKLQKVRHVADNETSVIVLRHAKEADAKDSPRTGRGAKVWRSTADQQIFLERRGQRRTDRLYNTRLVPDKTRPHGLLDSLLIHPAWTGDAAQRGLVLAVESPAPAPAPPLAAAQSRRTGRQAPSKS